MDRASMKMVIHHGPSVGTRAKAKGAQMKDVKMKISIVRKYLAFPSLVIAATALQSMVTAPAMAAVNRKPLNDEEIWRYCRLDPDLLRRDGAQLNVLRLDPRFNDLLLYTFEHCPLIADALLDGATGSIGSGDGDGDGDGDRGGDGDGDGDGQGGGEGDEHRG